MDKILFPWQRQDLQDIWKWPISTYMNTFGWWAADYSKRSARLVFRGIMILFLVVNCVYMVSLTIGVTFLIGSAPNVIDSLFSFFTAAPSYIGFVKIVALVAQRSELRRICKSLDEMLAEVVGKGVHSKLEKELRWRYRRCWIMFGTFLTIGSCITLHWVLRPLVYAVSGTRAAIVDTWPTYLDTWLQWCCTYIFQAMNISSIGHGLYMYDNIYFCICENILIQFAILKHHLKDMDISQGKPGGITLDYCVAHHIKLTDLCIRLRNCTKTIILMQVTSTVSILCVGVFELASGRQTDPTMITNLMELLVIFTSILFLYTWYSNEVTLQFGLVYETCYMSDWAKGTPKQQRIMLTTMTRSMKPVIFGGLVKVDLSTFITVLKTTFSYYQFLDAMDNGKKRV